MIITLLWLSLTFRLKRIEFTFYFQKVILCCIVNSNWYRFIRCCFLTWEKDLTGFVFRPIKLGDRTWHIMCHILKAWYILNVRKVI